MAGGGISSFTELEEGGISGCCDRIGDGGGVQGGYGNRSWRLGVGWYIGSHCNVEKRVRVIGDE